MLFNKSRAVAYMRQCGLDALVATSPVNITYLTDYYFWLDPLFKEYWLSPGASSNLAQSYAIFPLEGEPALVVGPQQAGNAADLWVRDLHTYGDTGLDETYPPTARRGEAAAEAAAEAARIYDVLHAPQRHGSATEALAGVLQARGLLGARIGVEMEGLTAPARLALPGALPKAQLKDCSNLLRLIRAVKSAEEIERLARAAEISEQAGLESLARARPGVMMGDIVQHYRARIGEMGADLDHFAFGYRGMGVVTEPSYRLAADDVMFVDWGCNYRHYFSDTGTTLAVGDLPPRLAERHAALRAGMAAGIDAIWPGAKCSAVHAALRETLAGRGVTAVNPHGHGLGLEVRDYPIIVADNGLRLRDDCIDVASDLPLEEGMVFNLECAIFMPGVGSPHIERSFVVTPEGGQPLTAQDRSAPIRPEAAA